MPATMTFKTLKSQALRLPPKRQAELAEALLQAEYERECLEKAEQTLRDYESGKITARPFDEVMKDLRKYSKSLSRK